MAASFRDLGWHRSANSRRSVDADGREIPWFTYSAIQWLDKVLNRDLALFEYGAGSSTVWLAARVNRIESVESDHSWFNELDQPENGSIVFHPSGDDWWHGEASDPYVVSITAGGPWDVIVVDGLARTQCAERAIEELTDVGFIVLDDTDKAGCIEAIAVLRNAGFRQLDFWGVKPAVGVISCTSIFTRSLDTWFPAICPTWAAE